MANQVWVLSSTMPASGRAICFSALVEWRMSSAGMDLGGDEAWAGVTRCYRSNEPLTVWQQHIQFLFELIHKELMKVLMRCWTISDFRNWPSDHRILVWKAINSLPAQWRCWAAVWLPGHFSYLYALPVYWHCGQASLIIIILCWTLCRPVVRKFGPGEIPVVNVCQTTAKWIITTLAIGHGCRVSLFLIYLCLATGTGHSPDHSFVQVDQGPVTWLSIQGECFFWLVFITVFQQRQGVSHLLVKVMSRHILLT